MPAGTSSASRSALPDHAARSAAASATRVLGYANGWYRTERTPEAFVAAAENVVAKGFKALKLDPFGTAQGFISDDELELADDIVSALRDRFPTVHRPDRRPRPLHRGRGDPRRARVRAARPLLVGGADDARARGAGLGGRAAATSLRVATGEMYDTVGQFFTLAEGGGVNIFQPEPMSLGGFGPTLAVAHLAAAQAPGSPRTRAAARSRRRVCLQLAACVPNFLIQEHFDAFNDPWTRDLVTWSPTIDRSQRPPFAARRSPGSASTSSTRSPRRTPTTRTPT